MSCHCHYINTTAILLPRLNWGLDIELLLGRYSPFPETILEPTRNPLQMAHPPCSICATSLCLCRPIVYYHINSNAIGISQRVSFACMLGANTPKTDTKYTRFVTKQASTPETMHSNLHRRIFASGYPQDEHCFFCR